MAVFAPHPDNYHEEVTLVRYGSDSDDNLIGAIDAVGARTSYRYADHLLVQEDGSNRSQLLL